MSDLEQQLALIHSSPPDALGKMLHELLSNPRQHLDALSVVVPELSLLLSRLLVTRDLNGANQLTAAIEEALERHRHRQDGLLHACSNLDGEAGRLFAYHMGRLQGLVVLARRLPALDLPDVIRGEIMDGGENQWIVEVLAHEGALTIRNLLKTLKAQRPLHAPTEDDLHHHLSWLTRVGVIDTRTKRAIKYSVSPLGRRLLEPTPPWLEAVRIAYQAYRNGTDPSPSPFADVLLQLFGTIDQPSQPPEDPPGHTGPPPAHSPQ